MKIQRQPSFEVSSKLLDIFFWFPYYRVSIKQKDIDCQTGIIGLNKFYYFTYIFMNRLQTIRWVYNALKLTETLQNFWISIVRMDFHIFLSADFCS